MLLKKKLVLFAFSLSFKLGMDKRSETCSFQPLEVNIGNSSVLQVSAGGCGFAEEQQVMLWDYSGAFSSEQVQLFIKLEGREALSKFSVERDKK